MSTEKPSKMKRDETVSDDERTQKERDDEARRRAQHRHWMQVMMEGQSTPDTRYQIPKRDQD